MKKIVLLFLFFYMSIYLYAFEETGVASWYGPTFHGKLTANGEIFNTNDYTAAHRYLPFGSIVKVISLENGKSTIVRINDRGPFAKDRIIDLSMIAAKEIAMLKHGTMKVKIILLEKGKNVYHRYSNDKYAIQIASFADKDKAGKLAQELTNKGFNIEMKRVMLNKLYFRLIIDELNYAELQLYRVMLHKEGITNYLTIKK